MRVVLFGATGMLGKAVAQELIKEHINYVPVSHRDINISYNDQLDNFFNHDDDWDAIVNCAGMVPQRHWSAYQMIGANAYGPHLLARYGYPTIHVSTDCVFGGSVLVGDSYKYKTTDPTCPRQDVYSQSKVLGESPEFNVHNVRASFIGYDHGLLKWFLAHNQIPSDSLPGYINWFWSGSSVQEIARAIVKMVPNVDSYGNIVHIATAEPISKYQLLVHLRERFGVNVQIVPIRSDEYINRALEPTIVLPRIEDAEL